MGTEYALADDITKEAYDLGKGPWYLLNGDCNYGFTCPPKSKNDVRELLQWWTNNSALPKDENWVDKLSVEIWKFMELHPNWKLIHDLSDDVWYPKEYYEKEEIYETMNKYIQIGSRYNI